MNSNIWGSNYRIEKSRNSCCCIWIKYFIRQNRTSAWTCRKKRKSNIGNPITYQERIYFYRNYRRSYYISRITGHGQSKLGSGRSTWIYVDPKNTQSLIGYLDFKRINSFSRCAVWCYTLDNYIRAWDRSTELSRNTSRWLWVINLIRQNWTSDRACQILAEGKLRNPTIYQERIYLCRKYRWSYYISRITGHGQSKLGSGRSTWIYVDPKNTQSLIGYLDFKRINSFSRCAVWCYTLDNYIRAWDRSTELSRNTSRWLWVINLIRQNWTSDRACQILAEGKLRNPTIYQERIYLCRKYRWSYYISRITLHVYLKICSTTRVNINPHHFLSLICYFYVKRITSHSSCAVSSYTRNNKTWGRYCNTKNGRGTCCNFCIINFISHYWTSGSCVCTKYSEIDCWYASRTFIKNSRYWRY